MTNVVERKVVVTNDVRHEESAVAKNERKRIDIYLNGVKVRDLGGWNTSWTPHAAWTKTFASALRQGENVLAFTLRGEKGDGMANYFDC